MTGSETGELLPCPFCGDDKISIKPRSCIGVPRYFQAECEECAATSHGSFHLDKAGAASEWNTRAQPQAGEAVASKILDHKWLDSECIERGCQSLVWKGRYESAVKGRKDFREAYKEARSSCPTPTETAAHHLKTEK
jgi:Lar family restriction alleviation protein